MEVERFKNLLQKRLELNVPIPVAYAIFPFFSILKSSREAVRKAILRYERKGAPFLSIHAFWMFWPLYTMLKINKICFVVNIAGGVGHIICELDQFFRKMELEELDASKRYVWLRKNDEFSKVCVERYGRQFTWAQCNTLLYYMILPILIRCKDITHDAGLSRLKWQLDDFGQYYEPIEGHAYLCQISKEKGIKLWVDYYQRCQKTKGIYPLVLEKKKNAILKKWLQGRTEKIVLLQLKDRLKNASPALTDPQTYLPAIKYLQEAGYTMVFVGREKMPELFKEMDVLNYSESAIASFENDIDLYSLAEFSINSGSGVAFLADSYDRPYLYVNSWQLLMSMFSPKCIMVPALVQKKDGNFLTFFEQLLLYKELDDSGREDFPKEEYSPRNVTGDEILEAVKEIISLCKQPSPRSHLQEKFRALDQDTPLYYAEARISDYFLHEHTDLFDFTCV